MPTFLRIKAHRFSASVCNLYLSRKMGTFIIITQSFFTLLVIFHVILAIPQNPNSPNGLFLHVSKDPSTLQYVTKVSIDKDAPLFTPINLVVDLSSCLLWLDCESDIISLSSSKVKCCSLECLMASQSLCDCTWPNENQSKKKCDEHVGNPITSMADTGELNEGFISFDGGNKKGTIFTNFLYSCAKTSLLKGLGSGVKGVLGLGDSRVALPLQAAKNLGFSRKFALCLSSSTGVIISGESDSRPYDEISRTLMYTPLSFSKKDKHHGYNINVKSIKINGKKLALHNNHQQGLRSTIISTTVAYTSMGSRIYDIFTKAYIKVAKDWNFTKVSAVEPFGVCFSSRGVGLNVPIIDLILQSEMVKWRIYGRNSMVHVNDEVMCLGFVNGGLSQEASIVIGGYQLEDNFLEFNLENSMLGFSSSLSKNQRSCTNLRTNSMFFKDSM